MSRSWPSLIGTPPKLCGFCFSPWQLTFENPAKSSHMMSALLCLTCGTKNLGQCDPLSSIATGGSLWDFCFKSLSWAGCWLDLWGWDWPTLRGAQCPGEGREKNGAFGRWCACSIGWFFRFQPFSFQGVHSCKCFVSTSAIVSMGEFLTQIRVSLWVATRGNSTCFCSGPITGWLVFCCSLPPDEPTTSSRHDEFNSFTTSRTIGRPSPISTRLLRPITRRAALPRWRSEWKSVRTVFLHKNAQKSQKTPRGGENSNEVYAPVKDHVQPAKGQLDDIWSLFRAMFVMWGVLFHSFHSCLEETNTIISSKSGLEPKQALLLTALMDKNPTNQFDRGVTVYCLSWYSQGFVPPRMVIVGFCQWNVESCEFYHGFPRWYPLPEIRQLAVGFMGSICEKWPKPW